MRRAWRPAPAIPLRLYVFIDNIPKFVFPCTIPSWNSLRSEIVGCTQHFGSLQVKSH